ncbi:MAG TPA: FixG Ig-like domain-containing protein, partial [Pelobium sp.]
PKLNLRMKAYGVLILIMMGVSAFFILSKKDIDVNILRAAGTMYQEQPGGFVSNLYTAELVNKSAKPAKIEFVPEDKSYQIKWVQPIEKLAAETTAKVTFFLLVPEKSIEKTKTAVTLQVIQNGKVIDHIETNFLGPVN